MHQALTLICLVVLELFGLLSRLIDHCDASFTVQANYEPIKPTAILAVKLGFLNYLVDIRLRSESFFIPW